MLELPGYFGSGEVARGSRRSAMLLALSALDYVSAFRDDEVGGEAKAGDPALGRSSVGLTADPHLS